MDHPNHPGQLSVEPEAAERLRDRGELHARARAIEVLQDAGIPFLVGGAYAYATYTGVYRDTKDLDLFPRQEDALRALDVLAKDGWRTERTDEVWLYKAFRGEWFVDFIFSSGNGVAVVDDAWFEHAKPGVVFEHEVLVAPAEEVIWSKAFVCERERYDGADVNHLLRAVGRNLDWPRLMARFDRYWEVLLSHLMMFRFAYPADRDNIPHWVMAELLSKTVDTVRDGNDDDKLCRGNLISRVNYRLDIENWGYQDGRRRDERERAHDNGDSVAREAGSKIRVAAVGDLHCRDDQHGRFRNLVKQLNASADILLLCGDLTDRGLPAETKVLAEELAALHIPCVAVLGNHDYEGGHQAEVCSELTRVGVHMLDGDHYVFEKTLGIAGVKGFCGGFGRAQLQAFGEGPIKAFVQEGVTESLKLEAALGQLDTPKRIVMMHYAPIAETLVGENEEIFPFMGSTRFAQPIDHYGAEYVFHGHAHHGTREGKTPRGIPVFNVAMPLLTKHTPDQRFVLVEV